MSHGNVGRDYVADSILYRLARANWTSDAIDAAIGDYAADAAIWDRAQAYDRAEQCRRGLRMLLTIRDDHLDREAFRRRFVYRQSGGT